MKRNTAQLFVSFSSEKKEPWPLFLPSLGNATMDTDPEVRVENAGKKEKQEKDKDGEEKSAVQSPASFFLEKETEEPPPLLHFLASWT